MQSDVHSLVQKVFQAVLLCWWVIWMMLLLFCLWVLSCSQGECITWTERLQRGATTGPRSKKLIWNSTYRRYPVLINWTLILLRIQRSLPNLIQTAPWLQSHASSAICLSCSLGPLHLAQIASTCTSFRPNKSPLPKSPL